MSFDKPNFIERLADKLLNHGLGSSLYRGYVNTLLLEGDEKILELGCGSGAATRFLAQRLASSGGMVTGLDSSEAWIEIARKRLRRYDNVELKAGDIRTVNVPDGTYDAAFIHFMLHDIDEAERPAVMSALLDKLKPGGVCFIREPTKTSHGMSPDEIRQLMSDNGLAEAGCTQGQLPLAGPFYAGVFRKEE